MWSTAHPWYAPMAIIRLGHVHLHFRTCNHVTRAISIILRVLIIIRLGYIKFSMRLNMFLTFRTTGNAILARHAIDFHEVIVPSQCSWKVFLKESTRWRCARGMRSSAALAGNVPRPVLFTVPRSLRIGTSSRLRLSRSFSLARLWQDVARLISQG